MKIFAPVFLDCTEVEVICKFWLIQAENEQDAWQKAKDFYNKPLDSKPFGMAAFLVPHAHAHHLLKVKELKFEDGITMV